MQGLLHPSDKMTSRQRLLAAYRGEPVDRLPYWAKVANLTWRSSQPEAVRRLDDLSLLDAIGADGIFGLAGGIRLTHGRVTLENRRSDHTETRLTRTPDGELIERWRMDGRTRSWHPVEFPVKTRRDLAAFRWLWADVKLEADEEALCAARARCQQLGQRGITHVGWGTSPLMHLVEHVIGPINTHLMLADHPGEMNELIEQMHAANLAFVALLARRSPADVIVSVENTSTTLISPAQFRKYCLRHLRDYSEAIEAAGKMHELHMCGHLKALLEEIDTIPAASIEAFTSPTLGNTRLADGRRRTPSKTLVGGTNVNVWLWPVERIQQYVLGELAACPDNRRIVLTTAGVAPPGCALEKFRQIGQWIPTMPLKL